MRQKGFIPLELVLSISFIVIFVAGMIMYSQLSCEAKAISFEEHKFKIIGGCMVKHKGKWLPLENIRGFD